MWPKRNLVNPNNKQRFHQQNRQRLEGEWIWNTACYWRCWLPHCWCSPRTGERDSHCSCWERRGLTDAFLLLHIQPEHSTFSPKSGAWKLSVRAACRSRLLVMRASFTVICSGGLPHCKQPFLCMKKVCRWRGRKNRLCFETIRKCLPRSQTRKERKKDRQTERNHRGKG